MKKKGKTGLFAIVLGILVASASWLYADDIANRITLSRQFYTGGLYQTSLRNGLEAMDLVYQKQVQRLIELIPVPTGYSNYETNSVYSFSDQGGILDYSLQVQKNCSNEYSAFNIFADTSLNNVERIVNLIRSYDYLSDKAGYKKFTLKLKKTEWTYLTEKSDIYVIPVLVETNETVTSGLLFKITMTTITNMKTSEREKMVDARMKDLLGKINVRELTAVVK